MLTITNSGAIFNDFERDYLSLLSILLHDGVLTPNARTGHDTYKLDGQCVLTMDVRDRVMPVPTTKAFGWNPMVGELIGFMRGYDNAAKFRSLGCKIWDDNANNNDNGLNTWVTSPNRVGADDLGRIYGVQWRGWNSPFSHLKVDQLRNVVNKLAAGQDDRRLIVSAWNPGEMSWMALPPCHMMWQVFITGDYVDLVWYQRSADVFLGVPFNCASYALLLNILCLVNPKLKPRFVTGVFGDTHLYDNQLDAVRLQLSRDPHDPTDPPRLVIDTRSRIGFQNMEEPNHRSEAFMHWLEYDAKPDMFKLENYNPQPAIRVDMVV